MIPLRQMLDQHVPNEPSLSNPSFLSPVFSLNVFRGMTRAADFDGYKKK